jgi:hypothetical protein
MGLFDMFGAGGGSVAFQLQSPMVQAGSAVTGNIVFTGGKRAQQITKITLKLTQETRSMQMTNNGPQPHTQSRDVVPMFQVTGPFASTPGQPTAFPFQIPVPQGAPNTMAGQVTYHLRCAVDIDNEVDPGSAAEIQVVGGTQPQMGGMPGNPMMQQGQMGGMPQQMMGGMPGQMMGQPMGMQPQMMQPQMGGQMMQPQMGGQMQIANGTHVLAQWGGDGQMHPGRVVGFQNGMYGVDWDEPRLGATTYVYAQQLQMAPAGMGGMHKGHDPMHKGHDPMHKGHDPMHQKGMDPMHKGQDPMHKGHDPYAQKGHDPMHKGHDPHAKGNMGGNMGMQQPQMHMQMGAHVLAQHPSGQWAPGRVAGMQNGMIGVDWDDAKLGQSTWVQPGQVRQK